MIFRDTAGRSLVTHARAHGLRLERFTARVEHRRLQEQLGYWLAGVRVGKKPLETVHFLIPHPYKETSAPA